jgi:multidrug efflux pump subunit AcrB
MTSLAFIFGVVPLVWAVGAGAELRQALGTAVFAGMIGVTAFGLVFTPVFYVITRWLAGIMSRRRVAAQPAPQPAE